ncbi:branched-chain amino acid transport system permease protein [Variovorax sp. YR266]|uniref:branched-chain amino acid ABC transporter permease n=1 Tax=Variovorax sp. YR266 TaxID=1884386 RepID=UPI000894FBE6|nr:branched-chain amino acid ABC transporter permease [Variovorax sp. YR266]SDY35400.1 branched-chain amino acid transport system permease protein [Variovorax sp. YR266]
MTSRSKLFFALSLAAFVALAFAPQAGNDYTTSLLINVLLYANLATAWGIFCGTTRFISLATVAFFGVGCYTVAVLSAFLPWPAVLAVAALLGGALALAIGICTLRLSGMYFVVFSFGIAELIRQLVTWYEAKLVGSVGRYVFLEITPAQIYWQLLVLLAMIWILGAWLSKSRLGFALRLIGEDETAARGCGINTVAVRLAVLTGTAMFMSVAGAIVAPRWTYIEPSIAFNSLVSFQVVVMALLGGVAAFYGPVLGTVPLVLAFEVLTKYFPNHFSIVLGAIFLVIVYLLPQGLLGVGKKLWRRL